ATAIRVSGPVAAPDGSAPGSRPGSPSDSGSADRPGFAGDSDASASPAFAIAGPPVSGPLPPTWKATTAMTAAAAPTARGTRIGANAALSRAQVLGRWSAAPGSPDSRALGASKRAQVC